jgi:homeobox protein cut-like
MARLLREAGKDAESFTSPLSVVCHFWKEFDLESMRTKLDEVGLKVAELQEDSVQNRRKLADATRDFKRSAADGVSKSVGSIMRLYQEEIDRLTKRAKHGEGAFLELYQKLFEAPDPAPALSLAFETTSRVTELETTNKKLAQELAEYKAESTQIKNQDLTIRKHEEKVRDLEAQLEEKEAEIKESKATAAAEADAAIMEQMQEREAQLTQLLQEAQASLAAMQRVHHSSQNQLFTIQSQSEEERVSRCAAGPNSTPDAAAGLCAHASHVPACCSLRLHTSGVEGHCR